MMTQKQLDDSRYQARLARAADAAHQFEQRKLEKALAAAGAAFAAAVQKARSLEEDEASYQAQLGVKQTALLDAKKYEAAAAQQLLGIPESDRGTLAGRTAMTERRNAAAKVAEVQTAVDALAIKVRETSFAAHTARERVHAAWEAQAAAQAALGAFLGA